MSETTTDSSEAAKFGVDGDRCSSGGGRDRGEDIQKELSLDKWEIN